MSKLLKSLIIGSVLSTVTPINFSSIGFSSSNINDNINDEEEIKIENKDEVYRIHNGILEWAKERNIDLEHLRTSDTSGMLGPKYNGGDYKQAAELVYNIKLDEETFVKNGEIDEMETTRKSLATMIEYVSIGKKLDFSNGYERMIKAIVAYMETKDEKTKTNIRNRGTDEATGVKYIAAAVVQEMLINLHKGMFLCALNENYKDACSKVEKELIEAQKNNGWGTPDISGVSIEETKLVRNTIEQVFGSIPSFSDSTDNLSDKSYTYLKYLRNCVIEGMIGYQKKLHEDASSRSGFDVRIDSVITDNLEFQKKLTAMLDLTYEAQSVIDEIRKLRPQVQAICRNASKNKGDVAPAEVETLDKWIGLSPVIKVDEATYENYEQSNKITELDDFLNNKSPNDPKVPRSESVRRKLIHMCASVEKMRTEYILNYSDVAKFQKIMSAFSTSTEGDFCTLVTNATELNELESIVREKDNNFKAVDSAYQKCKNVLNTFTGFAANVASQLVSEEKSEWSGIDIQPVDEEEGMRLQRLGQILIDDTRYSEFRTKAQTEDNRYGNISDNVRDYYASMNYLIRDNLTYYCNLFEPDDLPYNLQINDGVHHPVKIFDPKLTRDELLMLREQYLGSSYDSILRLYLTKILEECSRNLKRKRESVKLSKFKSGSTGIFLGGSGGALSVEYGKKEESLIESGGYLNDDVEKLENAVMGDWSFVEQFRKTFVEYPEALYDNYLYSSSFERSYDIDECNDPKTIQWIETASTNPKINSGSYYYFVLGRDNEFSIVDDSFNGKVSSIPYLKGKTVEEQTLHGSKVYSSINLTKPVKFYCIFASDSKKKNSK